MRLNVDLPWPASSFSLYLYIKQLKYYKLVKIPQETIKKQGFPIKKTG